MTYETHFDAHVDESKAIVYEPWLRISLCFEYRGRSYELRDSVQIKLRIEKVRRNSTSINEIKIRWLVSRIKHTPPVPCVATYFSPCFLSSH